MPVGSPRRTHWDFMIEVGGALRTWALAEAPADGREIDAEPLPDHRLAYLQLEGEISGGRGSVTRCDRGGYSVVQQSEDALLLELHGKLLSGQALLSKESPQRPTPESGEHQRWKFKFTSGRSAIGSPAGTGVAPGE